MAEVQAATPSFGKRVMTDLKDFFVPKETAKPAVTTTQSTPQAGSNTNIQQPVIGGDGKPVLDANGHLTYAPASNNPAVNVPANPLDAYSKLFEPIVTDDKAPKAPTFQLSTDIITKAAGGLDFAADLPAEVLTSLQAGALDTKTFVAALQHVGRQAYSKAMEHNSALTDKFVSLRSEYDRSTALPAEMRKMLTQQAVRANPNIKDNPIAQKHMAFISNEFAAQYPDATPTELSEMTTNYFKDMGVLINPVKPQPLRDARGNPRGDLEFDYESYLKNEVPQQ